MIDYTKPIKLVNQHTDIADIRVTAINKKDGTAVGYATDATGYHYPLFFYSDGTVAGPGLNKLLAAFLTVEQDDPLAKFRNLPVDTPIWCKHLDGDVIVRHLHSINHKEGYVNFYQEGCTSHSTSNGNYTQWPAELVFLTDPIKG